MLKPSIEPLHIGFMDLDDHHCREVVGKGEDGLATYCGHPKHGNSSYCQSHSAVNELLSVPKKVNGYFVEKRSGKTLSHVAGGPRPSSVVSSTTIVGG